MKDITATVRHNTPIARNTYMMRLELSGGFCEARAGQFIMLRVSDSTDPFLRRPFSIAGIQEDGSLLLLYRVVGKGTAIMSQWREGTRTEVLGPLGNGFALSPGKGYSILVAGGIGIAPLVFLSRQVKSFKTSLLLGARTKDELVPVNGLVPEGLEISTATEDGSMGRRGLVTGLLQNVLGDVKVEQTMVYACGPWPMLREVSRICSARGIPCQVSLETAMACGVGACLGCVVRGKGNGNKYYRVCKDGPVFNAEKIDWDIQ